MTQARLSESASLDRSALAKVESGRRRVAALELARIARALDVPADRLLDPSPERSSRAPALRTLRRRRASILRVAAEHGAHSVRVFGSVARGDATSESDVDLLVEMEPERTLFDQAALLVDLRRLLGRDVDVVIEGGLRENIRERVMREAVPL
jgi:predicted nucleotidyltransferase